MSAHAQVKMVDVSPAQLSPGMERIRAVKDQCDQTPIDSFSVKWDEKYFRASIAFSTTSAFMDSLRSL